MGNAISKQFLPLHGTPVIMHTIAHFLTLVDIIFVALPKEWFSYWEDLQKRHDFNVPHTLVEGGNSRFESVKNAIFLLPDEGLVAVHDAVRPFVTPCFIQSCFECAEKYGNAVAAVPVKDSLRISSGTKTKAVDRNDFFSIQTPQVFPCAIIKKAYQQTFQSSFTDDATVVESLGCDIKLMQGRELNLKITTAEDLVLAEYIYSLESKE